MDFFSAWALADFESTVNVTQSKQTVFSKLNKQANMCLELTVLKHILWH
jgi:hypothetical protein